VNKLFSITKHTTANGSHIAKCHHILQNASNEISKYLDMALLMFQEGKWYHVSAWKKPLKQQL
jgi:hypothetical protein